MIRFEEELPPETTDIYWRSRGVTQRSCRQQKLSRVYTLKEEKIVASFDLLACDGDSSGVESVRLSDYHILDDYRGGEYEFRGLSEALMFCQSISAKVLFWTHRVGRLELSQYYKKVSVKKDHYSQSEPYKRFQLNKDYLFWEPDKEKSYFIYYSLIDSTYYWSPAGEAFIKKKHHGEVHELQV